MTPNQARSMLKTIEESQDPRIRNYRNFIQRLQLRYQLRTGGAETNKDKAMTVDLKAEQDREWRLLYDQIKEVLQQVGEAWDSCQNKGDYLLADDNMGWSQHKIELQNLALLKPAVMKSLQSLLVASPDCESVIAIDILGKETEWPPTGVVLRHQEIVD